MWYVVKRFNSIWGELYPKTAFSWDKKWQCGTLSISLLWPLSQVVVESCKWGGSESAMDCGSFAQSQLSLFLENTNSKSDTCCDPRFLLSTDVSMPNNQTHDSDHEQSWIPSMNSRGLSTCWMMLEANSQRFLVIFPNQFHQNTFLPNAHPAKNQFYWIKCSER